MAHSKCYICNSEITPANRSAEHILPNCIGGRLKSNKLICRNCNSLLGHDIDKELCEQLNFIANRLNIKRARGAPRPIVGRTSDSSPFIWEAGQEPRRLATVERTDVDGHQIYHIKGSAGSKELKRIIRDFQKIPNAKKISDVTTQEDYITDPISFDLGGKADRSVMKIAVNLWMLKGGDRSQIEHLIPFIKDGNRDAHRVSFYYPEKATENHFDEFFDELLHTVLVKGDSKERILYSYIELFSAIKFIVLLRDDYSGPEREIEYSWDVLKRKKINKRSDFGISRRQILDMMGPHVIPFESIRIDFHKLDHTTVIMQKCAELERSFERCSKVVVKRFVELPMTPNNLHVFALGPNGFLVEIYEQMVRGFVVWVGSARLSTDAMPATRSFLALRGMSLEIAKSVCLRKYPVGAAIDRESLLLFTVELLSQIIGYMGGDEKQAMEMFVRRHKLRENSAVAG